VHSKVQIIASVECGGSAALQFSQVGLSSSMTVVLVLGNYRAFDSPLSRGRDRVLRPGQLPNNLRRIECERASSE
jgi:hypothetical protein